MVSSCPWGKTTAETKKFIAPGEKNHRQNKKKITLEIWLQQNPQGNRIGKHSGGHLVVVEVWTHTVLPVAAQPPTVWLEVTTAPSLSLLLNYKDNVKCASMSLGPPVPMLVGTEDRGTHIFRHRRWPGTTHRVRGGGRDMC